ncbi:hypothetical protein GALMADRAFT_1033726 [Galerina marginata CBS 339.88]|uniref:Uncharacterized protein n=1 Tax=Galerina marginata (strain CBS 339.88) TaxID=685588 RepID=A0A067SLF6_GALM3|nr:hypothetical protein GALMADRAFT_1033726 [Galerina marginata CBS 339.88]
MLYLLNIGQLAIQWQLLQSSFVDNGETRKTIYLTTFLNPAWATTRIANLYSRDKHSCRRTAGE